VRESVLLGELCGGGGVIEVVFHDEVTRSPIQLIEGLHGLPDNLVNRIEGERWMVGELILSRSLKSSGVTESTGGGARLMTADDVVRLMPSLSRAFKTPDGRRSIFHHAVMTAQASVSLCTRCSW